MSFLDTIARARAHLEQQGRVSLRALRREFALDDATLDELVEELVEVQQVASREGSVLVATNAIRSESATAAWPTDATTRPAMRPPTRSAHPADQVEARKVVTIVFADLIGSTSLHERLDAESTRRLMERYYRALRTAVEEHHGTVVKLLGDGVMAAFGVPHVAEDDAIRAVRAAVAMQQAFRSLADEQSGAVGPIGLRIGVNTGEVIVSADNTDVVGDPANVAARLQQEAKDGEVIIGEPTRRLVRELVTLEPVGVLSLRGRAETVAAHRVVSLERPAGAAAVAFVGRDDELRRLTAVYETAVSESRARLAVILGSPGLGKSRLLDEFARRVGEDATVLNVRCESAGGATFAPIATAVQALLRSRDGEQSHADAPDDSAAALAAILAVIADHERIGDGIAALLAGMPASPEETFFVVRRFLAALATPQPVVFAIDDLQWAEPLLLDLVEHLVQWGSGTPLCILAGARPELRDLRSSLATPGVLVGEVITLAGLDAAAATRLATNVIGADLPAAVAGRVLAASEGNPLFLSELVRMLVNDGVLKRAGERWIAAVDLATLAMPPTIQALLAARIERLRPEDRAVLERAAVVGRQFSRSAVAHLLPHDRCDLDARLEALRRSELIEPDTTWLLGEPALRFHHGLTRDAAYGRLLKETRAELHGRLADWIEQRIGDSIEHDELLGWHLEQAQQHLRELAPLDAQGRALGGRAARYLGAAGRRALARDDVSPAADLLGRAFNALDAPDPARADLALDWCEALLAAGDVAHAKAAIDELARITTNNLTNNLALRLSAWHTCFTGQLAVLTDPQALRGTVDALAAAAAELAALGDGAGEAKAHQVHALALQRLGSIGACEAILDKALAAARSVGDRRRSNAVLGGAPQAALWGPSPVTRASGRCLDVVRVLRITQGAPAVEAVALRCQAVLEALRGRTEAARRMIASSRKMVEELGITQQVLETDLYIGLIEIIEDDAAAAERSLRAAYEGFRAHGLGIDAARAGALLGRALFVQGNAADAEALSYESEGLAGDDLQAAIAWRWVRAEALAARGDHATAVDVARTAVDIAGATDALLLHGNARMAGAAALRAAGKEREAAAEEARAIELWEAKGATLLAERARVSQPGRHARNLSAGIQEGGGVDSRLVTAGMTDETPSPSPLGTRRTEQGSPQAAHRVRRRVRPNAATATCARLDAAMAARDEAALTALFADDYDVTEHTTGERVDRQRALANVRSYFNVQDLKYEHEPLATLGSSLALLRSFISGSGVAWAKFDVGAYETETVVLREVDAQGRLRHTDLFPANRLGDAITRLYERYAELLPDGAERKRAAATARAVAALPLAGPYDVDRAATAFAPNVVQVDHRSTVGIGTVHGAQAFHQAMRALLDLSEEYFARTDDVLALRSDAFLVRWAHLGTLRAGGGAFERCLCYIFIFGADGLMMRGEQFDAEREKEALARFDELTGEVEPIDPFVSPLGKGRTKEGSGRARRVRPNAATAAAVRLCAAVAARDADAVDRLHAEDVEHVRYPTGARFDRRAILHDWDVLIKAPDPMRYPTFAVEPLATLGDSLVLCRNSVSAMKFAQGEFDIGPFELQEVAVNEVDAAGRYRHVDSFPDHRLGDAIVRLYERYAELLPDGPERQRATATARVVAALGRLEFPDTDAVPSDIQVVDHRRFGFEPMSGTEAIARGLRTLDESATDLAARIDDVLCLQTDALLIRFTNTGTARAGGGVFERQLILLFVFGGDGLARRVDVFDADRDAEALARFDELTTPAMRFENSATRWRERALAACAARDWDGVVAAFPPGFRSFDRRKMMHMELDRHAHLESLRFALEMGTMFTAQPLATRGERLDLARMSGRLEGSVRHVGPSEVDYLEVAEVNEHGDVVMLVMFDPDDLDAAYAELDERYAAGNVAVRALQALFRGIAVRDWEAVTGLFAPDFVLQDHRSLGWETLRGPGAYVPSLQALVELAPDVKVRFDHVRHSGRCSIVLWAWVGTREGGACEDPKVTVVQLEETSRFERFDVFGLDQLDAAWARYEELGNIGTPVRHAGSLLAGIQERGLDSRLRTAGMTEGDPSVSSLGKGRTEEASRRARRVRPNAATANAARLSAAVAAREIDALGSVYADAAQTVNHPMHSASDRSASLRLFRAVINAQNGAFVFEPIATLGDSLALGRQVISASAATGGKFDVGPYEAENIALVEVDEQGRRRYGEIFAADKLGDAIVRLYERCAEVLPDGPERTRAATAARLVAALTAEKWVLHRDATLLSPALEFVDHRALGLPRLHGAEEFLHGVQTLRATTVDNHNRFDDILALRADALIVRCTNFGTLMTGGGAFERQFLQLFVFGADGPVTRWEHFDVDREEQALARFDEIAGDAWEGEPPGEPWAERSGSAGALRPRSGQASPSRTHLPSRDSGSTRRRVRPNAATANAARLDAAIASRDEEALLTLFADDAENIDHPNHATWDRAGILASTRLLLGAHTLRFRQESLASIGNSLALLRLSMSAGGVEDGTFDVGSYERDLVLLAECDAHARNRRSEIFAADRLSDAIARLYERYAELLPEGPERDRATAIARTVAAGVGPFDPDREATVITPDIEFIDHRLLGFPDSHGAEQHLKRLRSALEVSTVKVHRIDDILGVTPDGLLLRWFNSGTAREGGGDFEREFLILEIFGPDGRKARQEMFAVDGEAEALARFDELTQFRHAGSLPAGIQDGGLGARVVPAGMTERAQPVRHVRANAATATVARLDAAMAARDADALPGLLADDYNVTEHTTGARYEREAALAHFHSILRTQDLRYEHQPLATLGSLLGLFRSFIRGSGVAGARFDVGAYETETIVLREVDAQGRLRHTDLFPANRLGDAIARLYARYAELLPEGPERDRAAAIARAIAMPGEWAGNRTPRFSPTIEVVDHRILGTWSARGAEAAGANIRAVLELADNVATRRDNVLGLRPDALLVRATHAGTLRAGGGPYERQFLMLDVFGSDGLIARKEYFDVDRDAEALVRFDQLTGEVEPIDPSVSPFGKGRIEEGSLPLPVRRVRPNAATTHAARVDAAIAARDADSLPGLFAECAEFVDHTTGATYDRLGELASWRFLQRAQDPTCRHEPLATLGDSIALCRLSTSGSRFAGGKFDVGAYEREGLYLVEADASGRQRRGELFASNRLGDAIVRLYERYAELLPDGPERERAATIARSVAVILAPDIDWGPVLAPDFENVDHRILGTWFARGADAMSQQLRALLDLAEGVVLRLDDILDVRPDALIARRATVGTDRRSGGVFERPYIHLALFGADGRVTRNEAFDADRVAEALARCDELTGTAVDASGNASESPVGKGRTKEGAAVTPRIENAATRSHDQVWAALDARDWERVAQEFAPGFRTESRERMVAQLFDLDRDQFLALLRLDTESYGQWLTREVLATRGDRLALVRYFARRAGENFGESESEWVNVIEVDEHGRRSAHVSFDPDDLDAAYAELDRRYAAGEGAAIAVTAFAERMQRLSEMHRAGGVPDWEPFAALFAPDFVVHDHSPLGWGTLDKPAYVESVKALYALAPDTRVRTDHLWVSARATLGIHVVLGTREGGAFEQQRVTVSEVDAQGRERRRDIYTLDQLDEARARFAELCHAGRVSP